LLSTLNTEMKIKTLKNGLKLVIDKRYVDTVQIGFYILGGKCTENKQSIQYYHLLEHLLLYFTSKEWPDAEKNIRKFRRKGIQYYSKSNDYETHVCLQSKAMNNDLILDIVTYTLAQYQINESIFTKEKATVENELTNRLNKPFTQMDDYIDNLLMPKQFDTQESLKCIKSITLQDITDFAKHALTPERIVFYMAGNIPKYNTFEKYKNILESISSNRPAFSIESLKIHESICKIPGIYYLEVPARTTRLHFRWKLGITAFEHEKIVLINAISYILQKELIKQLNTNTKLVYSIFVKCFFDPINKHSSHLYIETDCMSPIKSKAIVFETIRIIDNIEQLLTTELLNEYKLFQCNKYDTNSSIIRDVQLNSSTMLWDKPAITHTQLSEHVNSITVDKLLEFSKRLSMDDVYFIYGGREDIFNYNQ